MFKKGLFGLLIIIVGLTAYYMGNTQKTSGSDQQSPTSVPVTPTPQKTAISDTGVFVPYWQTSSDQSFTEYSSVYYFGITATSQGVVKSDQGYQSLGSFVKKMPSNSYLTLRLLDVDDNIDILKNKTAQAKISKEVTQLANENGFTGVVLDLEMSGLPLIDYSSQINSFVSELSGALHQSNLKLYQTIYGDVFYRKRPFDVKTLSQLDDRILIMAYDFHKAAGEPGPNFPFIGKEKYGYDFQQMIHDFLRVVPADKLSVIFGMYGYDWKTDMSGHSLGTGTSISLNDINKKYIQSCSWENCVFKRDPQTAEVEIDYNDSSSANYIIYHKLWYEDQKSVAKKVEYLQQQGIGSIGYWAYGYF